MPSNYVVASQPLPLILTRLCLPSPEKPDLYHCVAGKVQSADSLRPGIESPKSYAKHKGSSINCHGLIRQEGGENSTRNNRRP